MNTHEILGRTNEGDAFGEVELREMLQTATGYREDIIEGRWVIESNYRGRRWEVIVEPDATEDHPCVRGRQVRP